MSYKVKCSNWHLNLIPACSNSLHALVMAGSKYNPTHIQDYATAALTDFQPNIMDFTDKYLMTK
jgi:hypothetical protein